MTQVYWIRHAQADNSVHEDFIRPLTQKGLQDCGLVEKYLETKEITLVASSPYRRAAETVSGFAAKRELPVLIIPEFSERKITDCWIDDFDGFSRRQWQDFAYKLPGGESLSEVQNRNIKALQGLLHSHEGENIAIGTHGTALSTVVNYYDKSFSYKDFQKIKGIMPWVVHIQFEGECCKEMKYVNLFEQYG